MLRQDVDAGMTNGVAANRLARQIPETVARDLAAAWLLDQINQSQRAEAVRIERAAIRAEVMAEVSRHIPSRSAARPRRGTSAYDEWVRTTSEGAAYEARRQADEQESDAQFNTELKALIGRYAENLRMEWTQELLDTSFALGDGRHVTWGDATREDHLERIALFERNAVANLEGAARHKAAIRDLDATGAVSLRSMTQAA